MARNGLEAKRRGGEKQEQIKLIEDVSQAG